MSRIRDALVSFPHLQMSEKTLNYRSPRDDTRHWKPSARQLCLGLLFLLGTIAIGWILLIGPTGAQFRLDTGDWRNTYFGIPGDTIRMQEPERSTILSLAAGSVVLRPEWVSVSVRYPEAGFKLFYRAARWAKTNPQISKALLEDIARSLKGQQSPPMNTMRDVLIMFEPVGPGVWKDLAPNWTDLFPGQKKEAVDYLKSKGLPIPSTAPAGTTVPAPLPPQG